MSSTADRQETFRECTPFQDNYARDCKMNSPYLVLLLSVLNPFYVQIKTAKPHLTRTGLLPTMRDKRSVSPVKLAKHRYVNATAASYVADVCPNVEGSVP
jgi:hypothetical protein